MPANEMILSYNYFVIEHACKLSCCDFLKKCLKPETSLVFPFSNSGCV